MELATKIFNRMTEIEKIAVRGASPARLDYLGDTDHLVDMPSTTFDERCATMREVHALCMLEFSTKSGISDFSGVTWKF